MTLARLPTSLYAQVLSYLPLGEIANNAPHKMWNEVRAEALATVESELTSLTPEHMVQLFKTHFPKARVTNALRRFLPIEGRSVPLPPPIDRQVYQRISDYFLELLKKASSLQTLDWDSRYIRPDQVELVGPTLAQAQKDSPQFKEININLTRSRVTLAPPQFSDEFPLREVAINGELELSEITQLVETCPRLNNLQLSLMSGIQLVLALALIDTPFSQAHLEAISRLKELTHLGLANLHQENYNFSVLARTPVEHLMLLGPCFTHPGSSAIFRSVSTISTLKTLALNFNTSLTNQDFQFVLAKLPQLECLAFLDAQPTIRIPFATLRLKFFHEAAFPFKIMIVAGAKLFTDNECSVLRQTFPNYSISPDKCEINPNPQPPAKRQRREKDALVQIT